VLLSPLPPSPQLVVDILGRAAADTTAVAGRRRRLKLLRGRFPSWRDGSSFLSDEEENRVQELHRRRRLWSLFGSGGRRRIASRGSKRELGGKQGSQRNFE